MTIKRDYIVEKRNVLNEIRTNNMTLQELRFFSIYLAKINSRDIGTRVVRFSLLDFQRIMEFGKLNINQLRGSIDSLLCKIIGVPDEKGGFTRFQLFKKCIFSQENGVWYIEIDAHDDALPLMFEFKERYFTYELWNALRLKSSNQLRMYEILKQYEIVGERIIAIDELRNLLGIKPKEYPRFGDFRTYVLDSCKNALEENTDICYTYEPTGKKGRGGKILTLKFTISKNDKFVDQLTLEEFLNPSKENFNCLESQVLEFYSDACDREFNDLELQVINNMLAKAVPYSSFSDVQIDRYEYLKQKYDELNYQSSKRTIANRFAYLKKLIGDANS